MIAFYHWERKVLSAGSQRLKCEQDFISFPKCGCVFSVFVGGDAVF